MHVTLGEAARQTGLSKSTISRAIRDGKLSGTRSSDTGSYRIEQSELQRYRDSVTVVRATAETAAATQAATPQARDAATDALVAELRGVIADLRDDRDHWRTVAERLSLPAPEPRMTWWRWLRTTG